MLLNSGTLYVVATPLGNPGDLSARAKECLESASMVLAEDTRRAGLACARWNVSPRRFVSVHNYNEEQKTDGILALLRQGEDLALISDAGMPILADPGYLLVRACREADIRVTVIPGPCAPVTALAGSGIPPQPFIFFGFLPRKKADQEKSLAPYAFLPVTIVFFERKDRIAETLENLFRLFGRREVCIARELTKVHEEYIHFFLDEIPELDGLLGELTIIVGPPLEQSRTSDEQIMEIIREEQPHGGSPRDVARRVQVRSRGWTNSEIYAFLSRKN